MGQELVTALVGLSAAAYLARRAWLKFGADAAARFLLRRGKVKWALRLKRQSRPGCDDCG